MTDVDVLSSRMKSRLHLQSKTIGAERIKKAKDNNEDIAVLSMFLPNASAVEENRNFYCSLGDYCRLGDPHATKAGNANVDVDVVWISSNAAHKFVAN